MNIRSQPQRTVPGTEASLQARWERDGFLILRHFYSSNQVRTINTLIDHLWKNRSLLETPITLDAEPGSPAQRRLLLRNAPDSLRQAPHRINDLYLEYEEIQRVALSLRLCDVLEPLLEGTPLLCSSRNSERGTQHHDQVDSLHMPSRRVDGMVACWIALDPVTTNNGPVRYYPGSHRIPRWQVPGERPHARTEEMDDWQRYMQSEIRARGILPRVFTARPGDLLIWHSRLLHGSSPVQDPIRTRRSLVTRYFRQQDYRHHLWRVHRRHENGYFYQRRHEPTV